MSMARFLKMKYKSDIGRLPIPIVHGLTLGEIATMANGEGWLKDGKKVPLTVIKCKGYTHQSRYELPIAPSPNLPDMRSVYLYPSLCYFEATPISLGRGTDKPFQIYGHPNMKGYSFSFTPRSMPGARKPLQLNKKCFGVDLSSLSYDEIIAQGINFDYFINAYRNLNIGDKFFRTKFEYLVGNDNIRTMIENGSNSDEIKATWKDDVEKFKKQRRPYLLYEE